MDARYLREDETVMVGEIVQLPCHVARVDLRCTSSSRSAEATPTRATSTTVHRDAVHGKAARLRPMGQGCLASLLSVHQATMAQMRATSLIRRNRTGATLGFHSGQV